MLLVAYLREIGNRRRTPASARSLGPMITVSSNDAADTIYYRVGDAALYRLARLAGMRHFSVAGYWGNARFSAEDQARFFNRIDRLVPKASRGVRARAPVLDRELPALGLLALLARRAASRRSSRAAGAEPAPGSSCTRRRCSSAGDTRVSMAVLTDGNPSHDYGAETLRGVAQRLFRAPRRRATAQADEPAEGRRPARAQPAARASSTSTASAPASG